MKYPHYPSQPNAGRLPSMREIGPFGTQPTSSTAAYYNNRILSAHGRQLAGLGSSSMEPAYALNELQAMAEADDVQGDGIFDPPGTQKNIHGSAGVFAVNYNLPGYHARELPFALSEERDITTGRQIRAVPSGAVANDAAAQIAFLEAGLYPLPVPPISLMDSVVHPEPTYDVMQNPVPIDGLGRLRRRRGMGAFQMTNTTWALALVGAGVVAFAVFGARKKGRR